MTSEDEKKPQQNFDLMKVLKRWKAVVAVTLVGLTVNSSTGASLHTESSQSKTGVNQPGKSVDVVSPEAGEERSVQRPTPTPEKYDSRPLYTLKPQEFTRVSTENLGFIKQHPESRIVITITLTTLYPGQSVEVFFGPVTTTPPHNPFTNGALIFSVSNDWVETFSPAPDKQSDTTYRFIPLTSDTRDTTKKIDVQITYDPKNDKYLWSFYSFENGKFTQRILALKNAPDANGQLEINAFNPNKEVVQFYVQPRVEKMPE